MPLIPLQIPPGFYRNGTDLEGSGRWRDGNLVRWREGSLRPVGGWRERIADMFDDAPRGMHAWEANNGDRWLAGGTFDKLIVATSGGITHDITPSGLTAGDLDAALNTGYGSGFYGTGFYGQVRPDSGSFGEATVWHLDNWGEYLVGCSNADGKLYEWQLDTITGSDVVTNGVFAADTDWTKGAGWTIAAGVASFSGSAIAALSQIITIVNGETYELTFTLANASAGEARVVVTTSGGDVFNQTFGSGTHTVRFLSDDTSATLKFEPAAAVASAFDVDDVSATKVPAAVAIANSPANNLGLLVTEERFLFALGAGGDPRKVQWSDQEDNTTWAPAATNQAGSQILQTVGQVMTAVRTIGQTLVLTDIDAHRAQYVGPPFVYQFERVGTSCGIVARKAAAATEAGVFWMGQRGFFLFDGSSVRELPCEVHDFVFTDINTSQISKAWAVANGQNGEVWWFYPSADSAEVNKYVAYDFKEGHWLIGELDRTAGVDRGVFRTPIWADATGDVYDHEAGFNYGAASVFAESGPANFGDGEFTFNARKLIPDEKTQGDVTLTFKTRLYPNAAETSHGPYTMTNPTSIRFSGRQARMRVTADTLGAWRFGIPRIEVTQAGRR